MLGRRPVAISTWLPAWIAGGTIDQGRCRWRPDGRAIAFVGREADDGYVVYEQDFRPGEDTTAGRRVLASLAPDLDAESIAFSPDGRELAVSFREQLFDLMLVDAADAHEAGDEDDGRGHVGAPVLVR